MLAILFSFLLAPQAQAFEIPSTATRYACIFTRDEVKDFDLTSTSSFINVRMAEGFPLKFYIDDRKAVYTETDHDVIIITPDTNIGDDYYRLDRVEGLKTGDMVKGSRCYGSEPCLRSSPSIGVACKYFGDRLLVIVAKEEHDPIELSVYAEQKCGTSPAIPVGTLQNGRGGPFDPKYVKQAFSCPPRRSLEH